MTQSSGQEAVALPFSDDLQLDIDQATQQVYAKIVDPGTGDLLREIPSQKLRALQAFAMKTLKPLIDTKA
ncbi:MAG: flagellar protein FlaG [Candidatus Eiseniibacteriota bacterium]